MMRLFNKINKRVSIIFSSALISIIAAQHPLSQVLFRSFYGMAVRNLHSLPSYARRQNQFWTFCTVIIIVLLFDLLFLYFFVCFYTMLSFSSTPGSKVLKLLLLYRVVVHVYGP